MLGRMAPARRRTRSPVRVALLLLVLAPLGAFACATRPDVRGESDEAQAWGEQQRREEERARKHPSQLGRVHPIATPEPRSEGATAPPPPPPPRPPTPTSRPPAVTPGANPSARDPGGRTGQGTCFAIDAHGTIVTAHHVITGARSVAVVFGGGQPIPARVVRSSEATDVALLRAEIATSDFLPLSAPRAAQLGMPVFTIGFPNPELLGVAPKFTEGAVSSLSGWGDEAALMQVTVPVQPGNSGGPLVDERGEVVGVMIARAAELPFLKQTGTLPQNVNFASKGENLHALLSAAPSTRPAAASRREAIDRTERAVCIVLAERAR
jgi:S1-C subfamily serine protease